jgi:hypothetical protein
MQKDPGSFGASASTEALPGRAYPVPNFTLKLNDRHVVVDCQVNGQAIRPRTDSEMRI